MQKSRHNTQHRTICYFFSQLNEIRTQESFNDLSYLISTCTKIQQISLLSNKKSQKNNINHFKIRTQTQQCPSSQFL